MPAGEDAVSWHDDAIIQYQGKGHFVKKTSSCSWCNGCVTAAMPMVFDSTLTLLIFTYFFFFAFFQALCRCYI